MFFIAGFYTELILIHIDNIRLTTIITKTNFVIILVQLLILKGFINRKSVVLTEIKIKQLWKWKWHTEVQ